MQPPHLPEPRLLEPYRKPTGPPPSPAMSHFGPPEIRDSYSLLVLNVSFRTTPEDLFPLFDRYGEVVNIHIPRDRRTGNSRGFAFVRYKYQDEGQMAVNKLDGRMVNGREIRVQFAKYGPNAERIERGRIVERIPKPRGHSRSQSPKRRYRDDYWDTHYRSKSRSRSRERDEQDRYRGRGYNYRSRSRSISPDYDRKHGRYSRSPVRRGPTRSRSSSPYKAPSREVRPSRPKDDYSPHSPSPSAKA